MNKSITFFVMISIMTLLISCTPTSQLNTTMTPTSAPISTPASSPIFLPTIDHNKTPTLLISSDSIPTLQNNTDDTPTITFTNTKNPLLPTVTEWDQYSFTDTQNDLHDPLDEVIIIMDIPKGWVVNKEGVYDYPFTIIHPNYYAVFTIDNISSSTEFVSPYSNVPNEGGMTVLWSRQIIMPDIIGIEYLWGKHEEQSDELFGFLSVNLFSQKYSRSIFISDGTFQGNTIDEFLKSYSSKYAIFEHIYKSIRISLL